MGTFKYDRKSHLLYTSWKYASKFIYLTYSFWLEGLVIEMNQITTISLLRITIPMFNKAPLRSYACWVHVSLLLG